MSVRDGRLVLQGGMSYRLLVLPDSSTMTPGLLRKIKELAEAGATVVGPRPARSPSLSGYPKCDEEVKSLAAALWGDCDGQRVKERRVGRGRIVWGIAPEAVLIAAGVRPDFRSRANLRFIHRSSDDAEIYFVASPLPQEINAVGSFRVAGRQPELWWPESGRIESRAGVRRAGRWHECPLAVGSERLGVCRLPQGREARLLDRLAVTRAGKPLLSTSAGRPEDRRAEGHLRRPGRSRPARHRGTDPETIVLATPGFANGSSRSAAVPTRASSSRPGSPGVMS